MRALIRFLSRGKGGAKLQTDKSVAGEALTIGRATDQTLHIRDRRVRLQHARIELDDGLPVLRSTALAGVTVNGRSQREAALAPGDVIDVGANRLTVLDAPEGYDLALSFELRDDADTADLAPAWSAPAQAKGPFSMRTLAWAGVAAVLLLTLLLPLANVLAPAQTAALRTLPLLPDDGLWLPGPVHEKHAAVSIECEACHQVPFQRVTDNACTACHEDMARHASLTAPAVLGEVRCAACHLEHNEPPSLVSEHQQLCAGCHADSPPGTSLPPAADFLDAHPAFRVTLLMPDEQGNEWRAQRLDLDEAQGAERSNLRFDHQLHVAADGILGPDGRRVLECADCHVPDAAGARMQPVTMAEHCADCHTLSFDPADPARTVPHGDPPAVLQTLTEYYSARLLGDEGTTTSSRLRRPGQRLSSEDRARAASEARDQAMRVAADLFERRACANCHVVDRDESAELPWRVLPVRLTQEFFPHARFSHAAHGTGVTACVDCHAAATSTEASDLLMPAMEDCRACHGSGLAQRNDPTQTESSCVLCHRFHNPAKGSLE